MSRSTALSMILASFLAVGQCSNHYTVVAPGTLHSKGEYNVALTAHDADKPITFKVDLTGPSINESKTVEVQPFSSEVLKFDLPKIADEEHFLKVEGTGGAEFKEESPLTVNKKQSSVLIQTDKALYKPGDLVRYRILFLDSNTRPAHIEGPIEIQITDGKQNIIKQLKNVNTTKSVYSGEIQLSELPVMGEWRINVEFNGESRSKTFGVEEYVLPKFEVFVDAEKHAYFDDGKIRATIRAKYTYGKPVKGEVEVTVKPKYSYSFSPDSSSTQTVVKKLPIDGKALVEVEMSFDKKEWDKQMTIVAVVEEKLTGNKQNSSGDVTVHRDRYDIWGVDNENTFEPGKPTEIKVKVSQKDGTPVSDSKHPLKISVLENYGGKSLSESEHPLDKDGIATVTLTLPDKEYVSLKANYLGVENHFAHLSRKSNITLPLPPWYGDSPLKARVKTEKPNLDNDVEIEVASKNDMDNLAYQIVGRGNILMSKIIKDIPDKKNLTFSFKPTLEMIPSANLYIQSINNGQLTWDEQTIDFGENLKNKISLETVEEAKPGEDVNIKVKTSPNAYVGLLGVDQSVLLLKKGNDLSKNEIFNELRQYNTYNHHSRYGSPGNQAGVITFTNANFTLPPPIEEICSNCFADIRPQSGQPQSIPHIRETVDDRTSNVKVRKEFPQVWLWDKINDLNCEDCLNDISFDGEAVTEMVESTAVPENPTIQVRKEFPQVWIWNQWNQSETYDRGRVYAYGTLIGGGGRPMYATMNFRPSSAFGSAVGSGANFNVPQVTVRKEFPQVWLWDQANQTKPAPGFGGKVMYFASAQGVPSMAASSIPKVVTVRKEFPQVWLWEQSNRTNANGEITIQKKVPDTITSWVLTGFSLDDENGLGLTDDPTKLKVFQPFFVSTNLPYSVKRGEVIAIPIIVFNYMDKALDTDVVMENLNDEFEFTEATNEILENPKHELKRSKRLTVPAQSGETISFMIRPKTVGHISLKVTATSPLAGDAILKMLPVEPEGVTEYVNKAALVDLRDTNEQKEEMTVEIPENAVTNSTHIETTVVGDLLGPTIKNLDSLVRKPYGCGEQNMVNFVPNILVLQYLQNIDKLTPEIENKAKKYMEIGYQRELTYKHDDGSYSAFGKSDDSGSTWLTAYVARSFRQAADHIAIDEMIIKSALEFLAKNQAANGSFPEVGKVIDHQHSSDNLGTSLTAFTVLAFLENVEKYPEYKENIEKGLKYIEENTDGSGDLYSLAIGAYAMNIAKAPAKDDFIKKLEKRSTTDGGRKWWAKPEPKEEKKENTYFYFKPRSANVETTAYGLLALLESGKITESLPVLKWLISQRNSNGGFESTQDTVVGLSSLIKFAEKFSSKDPKMDIDFEYDGEKTTSNIDKDNAIVLQSYELPPSTRKVNVHAKGNGIALVQVSYRYNLNDTQASPGFKLEPVVDPSSNSDYLKLRVCASYVPAEGEPEDSNMAVMEVSLPSGFTIDQDSLADVESTDRVKKVETKNSETVAVIYFESLNKVETCPVVSAYKTHKVAQLKPAPVVVYDYYDDTRRARKFYSPPESSLCDICEGDECGTGCVRKT